MKTGQECGMAANSPPHRRRRGSFVERSLAAFADAVERAFYAEELARQDGLLQQIDPRVKVAGLLALVFAAVAAHRLLVVLGVFAVAVVLARVSRVPLKFLAKRVWVAVLLFTGMIALPAAFITPGQAVARLPLAGWPITAPGLTAAAFLVARVEAASTLTVLLVVSTPWNHVLKALRALRLPAIMVVMLGMTCRYVFLLLQTAQAMFEGRRSRTVGEWTSAERRRAAAASAGVLISRSFQVSSAAYMAMQSRGFRGEIHVLDDFRLRWLDGGALAGFAALAAAAWWLGR